VVWLSCGQLIAGLERKQPRGRSQRIAFYTLLDQSYFVTTVYISVSWILWCTEEDSYSLQLQHKSRHNSCR